MEEKEVYPIEYMDFFFIILPWSLHAGISGIFKIRGYYFVKDLEPLVKAMYRMLEPLFYVLTFQILHSCKTALPWPIYLI